MKLTLSRRTFFNYSNALLGFLAAQPFNSCQSKQADPSTQRRRPNIVLIMADDMGFSDLGCYGSEISTPNLDRLAQGGLRFSQFYNAARCCPTRASLMTGLYPHQTGVGHMWREPSEPIPSYLGYPNQQCVMIPEALKAADYSTLMVGKWHLSGVRGMPAEEKTWPTRRGFERFYGFLGGAVNYWRPGTMYDDEQAFEPDSDDFYTTDAFTGKALEYVEEYAPREEPFFLYLAYNAPHWPLHAWPRDIRKYRGEYKGGWDELRRRRYRRMVDMGIFDGRWPLSPRDSVASPWADLSDEEKDRLDERMAVYAAQVDRMDQGIGKVLDKVRQLGKEENTLVLFLSDNGASAEVYPSRDTGDRVPMGSVESFGSYGLAWANASDTPFRLYKRWVHEGGIATPFIVHWPAVIREGGAITHQVGHVIDIMATVLDAAGIEYPQTYQGKRLTPLEGKSLLPVLEGEERPGHEALYWEHEGNRAVRQGKWKLVSYVSKSRSQGWELYDMESDRTEMDDVAHNHPQRVAELSALYDQWAARCGVLPRARLEQILSSGYARPRD